ncbi:MAG: hypothetical protein HYU37_01950 [Acidobacteria bacterium]|nr:hypothetical protein [Acidobacteriota bacterium]
MVTISLSEQDAGVLREWLEPKLVELRKEESHTDSPRFREKLYEVQGALERLIGQLPKTAPAK